MGITLNVNVSGKVCHEYRDSRSVGLVTTDMSCLTIIVNFNPKIYENAPYAIPDVTKLAQLGKRIMMSSSNYLYRIGRFHADSTTFKSLIETMAHLQCLH
ncbi:hypothetical protein AMTRI_Chr08g166840 [Amborella trichopoda]